MNMAKCMEHMVAVNLYKLVVQKNIVTMCLMQS